MKRSTRRSVRQTDNPIPILLREMLRVKQFRGASGRVRSYLLSLADQLEREENRRREVNNWLTGTANAPPYMPSPFDNAELLRVALEHPESFAALYDIPRTFVDSKIEARTGRPVFKAGKSFKVKSLHGNL